MNALLTRALGFLTLMAISFGLNVAATEANAVRLAVIPFSAPVKNSGLQQVATELPDLLMVELSHENRFQLVERTKVDAIWSELHLAEDGFVSAETAEQLGHVLSCDWLVGGSLVQMGTNTQIWIKVIDVHSSVVLDLKTFPYNPKDVSTTFAAIATFLAQIDPHSQPRQFIALGRFADESLSSNRNDWSQRLPALIEKHFLAAGYGVVERETIAPIFSEFQFESAGLTGDYTNRVKLKPAFWLVDGGYKWVFDTQGKLSVALRIQKIGGGTQIIRFDKPLAEVENAVVDSIQSALTNVPALNTEEAQAAESATQTDVGMRYAAGHDEFANGNSSVVRQDTLNKLKEAILLNPYSMRPKYMLGMGLFESLNPEEVRQGKKLLQEVAASKDPMYATMAKNLMDDFATGRLTISALPYPPGAVQITPHGQPLSWPKILSAPPANEAKVDDINEVTNVVPQAGKLLEIPAPKSAGYFEWITTAVLDGGKVLIACRPQVSHFGDPPPRTALFTFNPATQSTTEIPLPPNIQHSIKAIVTDENSLWLATDGDGLVQVSRSGNLIRTFGGPAGFPTTSISSLAWDNGRLLFGFNNNDFGRLDPETGKFTGAMADVNIFKPADDSPDFNPPPALGTNSSFMAMLAPQRCVAICPPRSTQWVEVNISTNFAQDYAYSFSLDRANPKVLWVGNDNGKVTLLDMAARQVTGGCQLDSQGWVQWILDDGNEIIAIAMGEYSGTYNLFCLDKPGAAAGNSMAWKFDPDNDNDWPVDFISTNFSKLVTVNFSKGADGEAALQRLHVHDNMFTYKDQDIFFGIKFTVPTWCDGDFQWMYSLAKTEQNQLFASDKTLTGVMTNGDVLGNGTFDNEIDDDLINYPRLHEILPYSQSLKVQTIRRERLEPGKTYAIWFDVEEEDYPDFMFAMTIDSERGAREYGKLPLSGRQSGPQPATTDDPPLSPEQLRSRFETAVKAKDMATALSLVYWQGSTHINGEERFAPNVFSQNDLSGEMERIMAHDIGSVTLRGLVGGLSTTNEVNGFRYRPNIPGLGILQVESTDRKWVEFLVYGKQGDGYYIPAGVKEPLPPGQ